MDNKDMPEYSEKKNLISIFILISIGIIFTCALYLLYYRHNFRHEADKQLESIADLKKSEIELWRKERLGDASLFLNNIDFNEHLMEYFSNPLNIKARNRLIMWIENINKAYKYNRLDIYDANYRKRLFYPENEESETASFFDKNIEELKSGHIVFNDFYRDEHNNRIFLMILVPIINFYSGGKLAAILSMRIDPEVHLYPFINYWPIPSRTAETLLVRREGSYAVFLNELRFRKNSPLDFRIPVTNTEVVAVKGVLGHEGVVEGIDYRGESVIAAVKKIPETPWIIVARIDKSEIYAPFITRLMTVILLAVLLILGAGVLLMLVKKQQNLMFYRKYLKALEILRQSEKEKLMFSNALEQSLNEIYIFDAETYKFKTVNRGARENTGYSTEEMSAMTPVELNKSYTYEQLINLTKPLKEGEEDIITFYTDFMRKNSSTYPVEVHLSINRDDNLFIATVIDITASRQMIKVLEDNMLLLQTLVETIPDMVWLKDPDGVYLICNPMFERFFGAGMSEIIGKTDYDFVESGLADFFRDKDQKAIAAGKPTVNEELVTFADDGHEALLETIKTPMIDKKGNLIGVLGIARDITIRKNTEEALKKSENKLREAQEMAHLGYWTWDVKSGDVEWSEEVYKIFRLDPEIFTPRIDSIMALSPWPDYNKRNSELINKAIEVREPGCYEQKFLRPDNSIGYYYSTFQGNYDEEGELISIVGTVYDITERKLAEIALQESEERYRMIFENINDAFFLTRPDGSILTVNPSGCRMFGRSEDEICRLGRGLIIDTADPRLQQALEIREETGFFEGELTGIRSDGTKFPIRLSSIQFTDSTGKPAASIIIRDITLQKQYEDALLLRSTAMDNAANAIVITDTDGIIEYVNPAFEKLTLFSASEAIGHNPRELTRSGRYDSFFYKNLWDTIASGNIWFGELINKRKDGSIYMEEMTIAPVKDINGYITNYVAIKQDVTEKKLASDLLNARVELINFSADHSLDELMVKALDEVEKFTSSIISFFHFVEADQNTLSLQAWSTATSRDFCKTEGKSMHYSISEAGVWVDCLREGRTVIHNDYNSLSHRKGLPAGHAEIIRELVVPIMRDNIIKGILGIGNKASEYNERDVEITSYFGDVIWDSVERKRAEEVLKEMNRELEIRVTNRTADLEKVNKELDSFTYSVSHDLRSPLRHISGFLEMLRVETGDLLNEKAIHYMNVIDESAKKMGELIEDLLSFSRMGRTSLSRQNVNMEILVNDVINDFSDEILKGNVYIIRNSLPDVKGDRAMLRVVYVNLISNAIKFSRKTVNPQIEIGHNFSEREHVFYVRDNGAGFNMQYANKLFGVFQRLHSDRDFEGTGIGLAMVKNIIERQNGRIWAESEPGKGTCFYFVLPGSEADAS